VGYSFGMVTATSVISLLLAETTRVGSLVQQY
jgi:hypothetical protein